MAFPASLDKSCLRKSRSSGETGKPGLQWQLIHTRRGLADSNSSLPVHLCVIILLTNDADFDNTAAVSLVWFKRSALTIIKQAFLLHKRAALFEAEKHSKWGSRGQIQPPAGFASAGGSFYTRFS